MEGIDSMIIERIRNRFFTTKHRLFTEEELQDAVRNGGHTWKGSTEGNYVRSELCKAGFNLSEKSSKIINKATRTMEYKQLPKWFLALHRFNNKLLTTPKEGLK